MLPGIRSFGNLPVKSFADLQTHMLVAADVRRRNSTWNPEDTIRLLTSAATISTGGQGTCSMQ
jgi:hypothetical protein